MIMGPCSRALAALQMNSRASTPSSQPALGSGRVARPRRPEPPSRLVSLAVDRASVVTPQTGGWGCAPSHSRAAPAVRPEAASAVVLGSWLPGNKKAGERRSGAWAVFVRSREPWRITG